MFELRQKKLIEHIKKLNAETKASGAVGMLCEDVKHWESYNVFDIGDFQNYLQREYDRNLYKEMLND